MPLLPLTRFVLVLAFIGTGAAQHLGVGAKGGVRLSDDLGGSASSESKAHVLSWMVTLAMPYRLSLELNALRRRLACRYLGNVMSCGWAPARAHSWDTPLMARRETRHNVFAGGYASVVLTGGLENATIVNPPNGGTPTHSAFRYRPGFRNSSGLVAFAVTDSTARRVFSPVMRYTRWRSPAAARSGPHGFRFQTEASQFDILIGITSR